MEEGANRGPAVAGVLAMALGAFLMWVAGTDSPDRPQVLGEALVATTTTLPASPPGTSVAAPPTTRRAAASRAGLTPTTGGPTTTAPAATTTTGATDTTSSPSTSEAPPACPTGAPIAEVRTWEAATGEDGEWSVIVSGAVTNRTGATVKADSVAIVVIRADGSSYDIAVDERPTPYPAEIADGGEARWTWNGRVPPGAEPVGADATVVTWQWTDAPARCA